ncbi:MAG: hypothetical protein U0354_16160 [Candidatus Sericytochromatia bacterium]
MFKILNNANNEEIAIITAYIESLNKIKQQEKIVNYWDSSSKKSNCERHTWKNKTISNWESSNKSY